MMAFRMRQLFLGDGRVFRFGISMGGYFAAATGLKGSVDGSVVCGGPAEAAFAPGREGRAGMAYIVGQKVRSRCCRTSGGW
ncbi:hypothetical protein K388_06473 [Streptomyces sp. KhCrAH-43]|nr:hypothetical protein K388_06473 [Streptomyces sp. KhCrAH-43]